MQELNSNGAVPRTLHRRPVQSATSRSGSSLQISRQLPIWFNYQKIIAPTVDYREDKTYPISRHLYLITNGQPTGLASDFINFILSPEGQKIVARTRDTLNSQLTG